LPSGHAPLGDGAINAMNEEAFSKWQLVPLMFTQDAVADAQSAVAMNILEVGAASGILGVTEYVIPWKFEVVGISIASDSARTAGSLTVDPTINGTVQSLPAVLNATNTQRASAAGARRQRGGAAGARVGAKLTTASWTPVTADIVVTVWVNVYVDGIG
jgi:hypothetical protein